MKVQRNYNRYFAASSKNGVSLKDKTSFKAAYTPRSYTETRNLVNSIYRNSKGTQKFLMDLYINSGEMLNNYVTAIGTAFVAPIFIIFNPLSKEDHETKEYTGMRQPISAAVTLGAQVPIMKWYNDTLDKHAAFLGVDEMDLSAKPPVSVLKPRAKQEYEIYKANSIKEGKEYVNQKEWVRNRIIEMQDEAFYNQLSSMREKLDVNSINMKDLVKPSSIEEKKNQVFKDVLKDKYNFSDSELEMFNDYKEFKSKSKKLIKAKQLDMNLINDSILEKAEDAAIKDLEDVIKMEAKVKHNSSKILKEMRNELESGKLEIMQKYKLSNNPAENHDAIQAMEKEINDLKESIYKNKLQKLKADYDKIVSKPENAKTEAEKVKEYAYRKIMKAGSIDKIKDHGDTLESAIRSVKIKKLLINRINKAEAKLKGWKTTSGVVIGLAILPLTCGILNWVYPKAMKKFFPELCEAKAASKAKLYGIQPKQDDKKAKEAK